MGERLNFEFEKLEQLKHASRSSTSKHDTQNLEFNIKTWNMPMLKTCHGLTTMFHMLGHINCHKSKYFRIVPQHPQVHHYAT